MTGVLMKRGNWDTHTHTHTHTHTEECPVTMKAEEKGTTEDEMVG